MNIWSGDPQADVQRASELAQKALALDDSNSTALALLSYVDWIQRRFAQAVAGAERAVAANPNSAEDYDVLAVALNAVKPGEALRAADKAMRLDPARQDFHAYLAGIAYNEMGRYQEAIPLLKQTVSTYPSMLSPHIGLIVAYVELGRDQDARAEAAEIMRINPQLKMRPGPFKDEALNKRLLSDLRKAGLK